MKTMKYVPLFFFAVLAVMLFTQPAAAMEKTLTVGTATANNSGDAASRTVSLDLKATNFDNVNGVVFTLTFDKDVFEFAGLEQTGKPIDNTDYSLVDGDGNPVHEQPDAATIAETIYYQANASSYPGRVLIAAAGAYYFAPVADEYVLFKVKFLVKENQGSGIYPIRLQNTIIGPETAANAGYFEKTSLFVAAGLAPDAAPETAQEFPVALINGAITVSGGFTISGTVKYANDENAAGATARLFKKDTTNDSYAFIKDTSVRSDGTYSFSGQPAGTYQVRINASKPGYQRYAQSSDIVIATDNVDVEPIIIAKNDPLVGKVTLNGNNVPGLKVKVVRKSDDEVIGYFNVDNTGNFVTSSLPGSPDDYDIFAVYGGVTSGTAMTSGETFDYELSLVDLEVTLGCMNGKNYMVHVVQADKKLEKSVSGVAGSNPETVTIENLIDGKSYHVSVVGDGIPVTYHDNDDPKQTIVFSESDPVTVASDTTVAFTFCDTSSNTISGTVTKNDVGTAIDVYAVSTDYTNVYVTTSSTDGGYSLEVAPGDYTVYGLDNNSAFYYKSETESTQRFSEKSTVKAASGDVDKVNIILEEEANAYFHGKVTEKSETGNPAAFALIVAENNERIVVSETDEKGVFRLEGFSDNEEATISMPSFPGTSATENASNDGTEVNLVVNQGYLVSGVVLKYNTEETVSGATVYLKDIDQKIAGLPVRSSSSGIFHLKDVASGLYTINAVHPSYKKYIDTIEVSGNESDLKVEMETGAYIHGEVTEDGTTPIQHAVIVALAPQKSYVTRTNDEGVYRIDGLEHDIDYNIFAEKQGYEPQHVLVTADNSGTPQNFVMPEITTTFTVGGSITVGGDPVEDGTEVILYSKNKNVYMKTTTSGGNYTFSDVMGADDYTLLVKRSDKPVIKETIGTVASNVTKDVAIALDNVITGTVDLSDDQAGKTVTVYLVSDTNDVLQAIEAQADAVDGDYTYTFPVQAGKDYKIAAFCEGYDVQWYDGKADFSSANTRNAGDMADITLTATE
jgi:hypothetical protein